MNRITPTPLFNDWYEFTMAAGYFDHAMHGMATFSLFVRPQHQRGYYIAAGLEPALTFLEDFHFDTEDIAFLAQNGRLKASFLDYLHQLRFEGEVWALPEGSIFFANEPIMEVTAPLIQAQLVETFLINTLGLHTLIASKAARCMHAVGGRQLIDFSLRRTQGMAAGLAVARSTYLAGFDATSNVLAARRYDLPLAGTMAHSFVQAFGTEADAFHAYVQAFPEGAILLLDTFDTLAAVHTAVNVAHKLRANGHQLMGVRLDSGDMIALSRQVRALLDAAGLSQVKIFASGGFDEYALSDAVSSHAAIDAFGVGTKVGVSADLPFLDMVYKMVKFQDRDVLKCSPGKETLTGNKQLFRFVNDANCYSHDIIAMREEIYDEAWPMLECVMQGGRVCRALPAIHQAREVFLSEFMRLPNDYKVLNDPPTYPVTVSEALQARQMRRLSELGCEPRQ